MVASLGDITARRLGTVVGIEGTSRRLGSAARWPRLAMAGKASGRRFPALARSAAEAAVGPDWRLHQVPEH